MKIRLKRMRGREHKMLTGKAERSKCNRLQMSVWERFAGLLATGSRECGIRDSRTRREAINLDVDVLLAPEEGNSRQPVLLLNRLTGARPVVRRQYPYRSRELRTSDLASYRARSDSHLWIVPDALVFPRVAARHHVKLVVSLLQTRPASATACTAFAECGQADIFLALNLGWDGHAGIVREIDQPIPEPRLHGLRQTGGDERS